jgi:hypothetical protein
VENEKETFRSWRPQGMTIRHSHVGQRISADQAQEIIPYFKRAGFGVTFVADKGIVRLVKGGQVSKSLEQLDTIWTLFGSDAVASEKWEAEKAASEKDEADRKLDLIAGLWERGDAVTWIDTHLAEADMNDHNKLELAKYLKGETDKPAVGVSWKWAEPLEKLGAVKGECDERTVDFDKLRELFGNA